MNNKKKLLNSLAIQLQGKVIYYGLAYSNMKSASEIQLTGWL